MLDLLTPVEELKGVGEKTAKLFNKLGVYTLGDILLFFPRAYKEFDEPVFARDAKQGSICAVKGYIKTHVATRKGRNMEISTATIFSEDVAIEAVWFRQPYIRSVLNVGKEFIFYGKLFQDKYRLRMEQALVYTKEQYEKLQSSLQPVYHLTRGLNNNVVKKSVMQAISSVSLSEERLPSFVLERNEFISYKDAISKYHFPQNMDELRLAHDRLAYEELFYFILNTALAEENTSIEPSRYDIKPDEIVDNVKAKLPFEMTKGQSETLDSIICDMTSGFVSQRLVQGDVGSGKTLVAFLAMLLAVKNGYQAAIMAPTEVLANQHFETFMNYMKDFGLSYPVALLTGSMKASERKANQKIIDDNAGCFVIGTHALITEKSSFRDLALVICDEQHRFGVKQREALAQKGQNPHIVVMSATPIPRTLAMILYGNMAVSVIREMPAKRLPIKSCIIKDNKRVTAYKFITDEIAKGHQAYIICPLVEASEVTEAESVSEYEDKLRAYIGDKYRVGILHGRMKGSEKDEVMNAFGRGETDILVSTTVVEVGINVPNATVMMIENANRFGLSQLHQLRGRVGRGDAQSYCIFMDESKNDKDSKRLDIMVKSNSGFDIAEEDLKLRGPGDFFGIRQSGDFNFKVADIIGDVKALETAKADVERLLKEDKELKSHPEVKVALNRFLDDNSYIL